MTYIISETVKLQPVEGREKLDVEQTDKNSSSSADTDTQQTDRNESTATSTGTVEEKDQVLAENIWFLLYKV